MNAIRSKDKKYSFKFSVKIDQKRTKQIFDQLESQEFEIDAVRSTMKTSVNSCMDET